MTTLSWSFQNSWNEGLRKAREERKLEKRDVVWASELGHAYIDVFLKMKGEKPSNDYSDVVLRKFDAGNIWENVIKVILKRTGILRESQGYVKIERPKAVKIVGRFDFLAGGEVNKEKAEEELEKIKDLFPENVYKTSLKIIEDLSTKKLKEVILEIKSISSFMFDKYSTSGKANPNHRMQLFNYLISTGKDEGHIVYISKDDARILEIGVFNPSFVKSEYEKWVKEFSSFYLKNQLPPKEKEIIFDEEWGKFVINWKVLYSLYLTKVYGYKDQEEVRLKFEPLISSWNRVLTRIDKKEKLTENNLEKIKEMEKWGFDLERVKKIREKIHLDKVKKI